MCIRLLGGSLRAWLMWHLLNEKGKLTGPTGPPPPVIAEASHYNGMLPYDAKGSMRHCRGDSHECYPLLPSTGVICPPLSKVHADSMVARRGMACAEDLPEETATAKRRPLLALIRESFNDYFRIIRYVLGAVSSDGQGKSMLPIALPPRMQQAVAVDLQ
eukprot:1158181-Pelagomonas_calceolata.AAC.4